MAYVGGIRSFYVTVSMDAVAAEPVPTAASGAAMELKTLRVSLPRRSGPGWPGTFSAASDNGHRAAPKGTIPFLTHCYSARAVRGELQGAKRYRARARSRTALAHKTRTETRSAPASLGSEACSTSEPSRRLARHVPAPAAAARWKLPCICRSGLASRPMTFSAAPPAASSIGWRKARTGKGERGRADKR